MTLSCGQYAQFMSWEGGSLGSPAPERQRTPTRTCVRTLKPERGRVRRRIDLHGEQDNDVLASVWVEQGPSINHDYTMQRTASSINYCNGKGTSSLLPVFKKLILFLTHILLVLIGYFTCWREKNFMAIFHFTSNSKFSWYACPELARIVPGLRMQERDTCFSAIFFFLGGGGGEYVRILVPWTCGSRSIHSNIFMPKLFTTAKPRH